MREERGEEGCCQGLIVRDTEKLRWGLRGGELLQSRDMTWGFNVSWRERIERKLEKAPIRL
jgi:hypothetical protein